jgi:EmrB/QacA subfamily drug resistance transporter
LLGGAMGDHFGRKRIFIWGVVIFGAGSLTCGMASGVFALTVFRMLQGIGGALMIPGSLALISSSISPDERGKAIGIWSSATTVVTMGGPALGGALADAGLWRYIFFINIPLTVITVMLALFKVKVPDQGSAKTRLDVPGALSIAGGLALLTFGLLKWPTVGITHWQSFAPLLGGGILIIMFIWIEKSSDHPMMPPQLFTQGTFVGVNLLTFFLYAGLGAGMLFLSLNLVQAQGYTQLRSGLAFMPFTLAMILLSAFAGRLMDRYGAKKLLMFGPLTAAAGLFTLSLVAATDGPDSYWSTFFPGSVIFGLGMSFTVTPLTATVMGTVSEELAGTASGVNNAITRIANVMANAVIGALAIVLFTAKLDAEVRSVSLKPEVKKEVMAQAADLGNAKPPAQLQASIKPQIRQPTDKASFRYTRS